MKNFGDKPNLLWSLLVLVFLQFIVVPMIDWQDEKRNELVLMNKRLSKAKQLLTNEESINHYLLSLEEVEQGYNKYFFKKQELTPFQLANQKVIEELAELHNIKVTSVGWKGITQDATNILSVFELQLRFTGKIKNLMSFQLEIEQMEEAILIVGMSMNIKGHLRNTLGKATGVFRLHYVMEES